MARQSRRSVELQDNNLAGLVRAGNFGPDFRYQRRAPALRISALLVELVIEQF